MKAPEVSGAVLMLLTFLPGQELLWTRTGPPTLGSWSVLVGDRNGDGYDDFMSFVVITLATGQRRVELRAMSGRDGTFLPGGAKQASPDEFYGNLARVGDMDGDGLSEYAATVVARSRNTGAVEVRSGFDDHLLWVVDDRWFGQNLAGDLDLNGDGRPDLLIGSAGFQLPGNVAAGSLWAYDHKGKLLYRRIGNDPQFPIGGPLARLGDVDADGCDDFLMGVLWNLAVPSQDPGRVDVVSGRSGRSIRRVLGAQPGDRIAQESVVEPLSACGDLDLDGVPDFVAGGGAFGGRGTVQVFSTATGQLLHAWYSGSTRDAFGHFVVGDLDVDRDGMTDIIATEPNDLALRGLVHVYSGRDWSEILRYTDPSGILGAGFRQIMRMPPQQGELFPRFLVGGAGWRSQPGPFLGRLYMFSGAPEGVRPAGDGCPGTLVAEPLIGLRDLGAQGARLTLSGGEPSGGAVLIAGCALSRPVPAINLHALGFTGCTLHPVPHAWGFKLVDATGYAWHDFDRPLGPFGVGLSVYGQWVALGSGLTFPGGATDALQWWMR